MTSRIIGRRAEVHELKRHAKAGNGIAGRLGIGVAIHIGGKLQRNFDIGMKSHDAFGLIDGSRLELRRGSQMAHDRSGADSLALTHTQLPADAFCPRA